MVRHAAWLLNRYLLHADGLTSYQRRWGRNYSSALCEFAETIQYRDPGHHKMKFDSMWHHGLWLGRDSDANEVLVGTTTGVLKARSIRRLAPSEQHDKSLLQGLKGQPWAPKGDGELDVEFLLPQTGSLLPPPTPPSTAAPYDATGGTPTTPATTRRGEQGQDGQNDNAMDTDSLERPAKQQRVQAILLPNGKQVDVHVNEDNEERRLQDPIIYDPEDYPEDKLRDAMQREMASMKDFGVYEEVPLDDMHNHDNGSIIQTKVGTSLERRTSQVTTSSEGLRRAGARH